MPPNRSQCYSTPQPPKPNWRTRLPFFYGWVVVGSVFVALAITYGVYYSFSVFFVALLEEFGWGRAATAGVFSVHLLVIGFTGVTTGMLIDQFGPAKVVALGGAILSAGLVAASRLTQLWEFYLYFGVVCGLGISLAGWVPCVTVVSRWFSTRRGAAIGIASAGIGMGTVAMVPFNQYLISSLGWRTTFLLLAAMAMVGIVPHALLMQVGRPEDLGLKPDGASPSFTAQTPTKRRQTRKLIVVDQRWASRHWSVTAAMQTARFWFLAGTITLTTLTNQMLWAHQAAYLVDHGFDKMLAASIVGLAGLLSMPGKICWGMLSDRLGREPTFSMGIATMLVAILLLALVAAVPAGWLVFAFAVAFAAGYAINAPLTPSAAADIFAGPDFGAVYGVLSMGTGIGGALGAWLAGYVFDTFGSYVAAFGVAALSSTTSVVCMWLASPRKVRRVVVNGS